MKPPYICSALILIALALLLCAETSEPPNLNPKTSSAPETPSPQISQKPANSESIQKGTAPSPSILIKPNAPNVSQNQHSPDTSAQKEATYTGLLVIIGVFAIIVSALQYGAGRSAAKAAKRSADAAFDSAQAAKLALHVNRPLVIVQEVRVTLRENDYSLTPRVVFRNYGHSPAILLETYLGLETCSGEEVRNLTEDTVKQWKYTRHSVQTQVVADGETAEEPITINFLFPKAFAEVLNKETAQVAHGLVRYRGAFELLEPYESRFCWIYVPPWGEWPNGFFVIGPKELNKTT